jgi:hypothetical protein
MAKAKTTSGKTSKSSGKGTGKLTGSKGGKKKDVSTAKPSQNKRTFTSRRDPAGNESGDRDLKRTHYAGTEEQRKLGQRRPKDFKAKKAVKKGA